MIKNTSNTHRYVSFLLRLWQEGETEPWRASLEDPRSGERKIFGETEELFQYLLERMKGNTDDISEEA